MPIDTGDKYIVFEREARLTRAALRRAGFTADAVAHVRRQEDREFAALHTWAGNEERLLDFLTDPLCPLIVTRQTRTRIFVALPEEN